jgi:hypothetical protein
MTTVDTVGRAILTFDAAVLIGAMWWAWRQGNSNNGTLTRGAALVASLGFGVAAAIVVYGLTR